MSRSNTRIFSLKKYTLIVSSISLAGIVFASDARAESEDEWIYSDISSFNTLLESDEVNLSYKDYGAEVLLVSFSEINVDEALSCEGKTRKLKIDAPHYVTNYSIEQNVGKGIQINCKNYLGYLTEDKSKYVYYPVDELGNRVEDADPIFEDYTKGGELYTDRTEYTNSSGDVVEIIDWSKVGDSEIIYSPKGTIFKGPETGYKEMFLDPSDGKLYEAKYDINMIYKVDEDGNENFLTYDTTYETDYTYYEGEENRGHLAHSYDQSSRLGTDIVTSGGVHLTQDTDSGDYYDTDGVKYRREGDKFYLSDLDVGDSYEKQAVLSFNDEAAAQNSVLDLREGLDSESLGSIFKDISLPSDVYYPEGTYSYNNHESEKFGFIVDGVVYTWNQDDFNYLNESNNQAYEFHYDSYQVVDGERYYRKEDPYRYENKDGKAYVWDNSIRGYAYFPEDGSEKVPLSDVKSGGGSDRILTSITNPDESVTIDEHAISSVALYSGGYMETSPTYDPNIGGNVTPTRKYFDNYGREVEAFRDGSTSEFYYINEDGFRQYVNKKAGRDTDLIRVESKKYVSENPQSVYYLISDDDGEYLISSRDGSRIYPNESSEYFIGDDTVTSEMMTDTLISKAFDSYNNSTFYEIQDVYGVPMLWSEDTEETFYPDGAGIYDNKLSSGAMFYIDRFETDERLYLDDKNYLFKNTNGEYFIRNEDLGLAIPVKYDAATGSINACANDNCYALYEGFEYIAPPYDPLDNISDTGQLVDNQGNVLPEDTTYTPSTGNFSLGGSAWSSNDSTPEFTVDDSGNVTVQPEDGSTGLDSLAGDGSNYDYDGAYKAPGDDYVFNEETGQWELADGSSAQENGLVWNEDTNSWENASGDKSGKCAWVYVDSGMAEALEGSSNISDYTRNMNVIVYDSKTGTVSTESW